MSNRTIVAHARARIGENDALADQKQLRGGVPAELLEVRRGEHVRLGEGNERGLDPGGDVELASERDALNGTPHEARELLDRLVAHGVEGPHGTKLEDMGPLRGGEDAARAVGPARMVVSCLRERCESRGIHSYCVQICTIDVHGAERCHMYGI